MTEEWERVEKEKKLREQWEGVSNFVKILFKKLDEKDKQIDYAKSIIKSLLDNSDEYAEQRAREFLKG